MPEKNESNDSNLPSGGKHGEGVYQMLWDCRFCGAEKLLGLTHRHCPACGAAQDPEWRYFPAEEDMIRVEDHVFVGADKLCPACGQPNSAANAFCGECGADLSEAKEVDAGERIDLGTGIMEADTRRDVVKEKHEAEMQRIKAEERRQPVFLGLTKMQLWIIAGVVLIVAIVAGIIYAVTYRKKVEGRVENLTWERVIDIEDYRPRDDGDWQRSMPSEAYGRDCYDKQNGTKKVQVGSHEECSQVKQGDGTFERVCEDVPDYEDQPVYETWCDYKIDRWEKAREVTASGEGKDPPPDWPTYTLGEGDGTYGQEQKGAEHEKYTVVIKADGKTHKCSFGDQAEWEQYAIDMEVDLKLNVSDDADCDTLKIVK
jgi:hypothetical protein